MKRIPSTYGVKLANLKKFFMLFKPEKNISRCFGGYGMKIIWME